MTIVGGTYYKIICNECGEPMSLGDDFGYLLVESWAEAISSIKDRGWLRDEDGALICEACCHGEA